MSRHLSKTQRKAQQQQGFEQERKCLVRINTFYALRIVALVTLPIVIGFILREPMVLYLAINVIYPLGSFLLGRGAHKRGINWLTTLSIPAGVFLVLGISMMAGSWAEFGAFMLYAVFYVIMAALGKWGRAMTARYGLRGAKPADKQAPPHNKDEQAV